MKTKKLPELKSDEEAEEFVAEADLTADDLSRMRTVQFEFEPKRGRVNVHLPRRLLDAIKAVAAKAGVPLSALYTSSPGSRRPTKKIVSVQA